MRDSREGAALVQTPNRLPQDFSPKSRYHMKKIRKPLQGTKWREVIFIKFLCVECTEDCPSKGTILTMAFIIRLVKWLFCLLNLKMM